MNNPKHRILLIEDERRLAHLMERRLIRSGFLVELAFDGEEGLRKAQSQEFELIILDLGLPQKDGLEVLKEYRAKAYTVPVLIVSARSRVDERISGLEVGADDYLTKPFDSGELVARVNAILRRTGNSRTSILQISDLTVDVTKRTVQRADKTIALSKTEYSLLEFFLQNKNQILTRKRIAEQVWGYTFNTGTNIVDVYINYLRRAIDDGFEPKLIQTVYGQGFILREP
jgi:DNA-binding response OmpR family regulator